jgi:hypothetical protein
MTGDLIHLSPGVGHAPTVDSFLDLLADPRASCLRFGSPADTQTASSQCLSYIPTLGTCVLATSRPGVARLLASFAGRPSPSTLFGRIRERA